MNINGLSVYPSEMKAAHCDNKTVMRPMKLFRCKTTWAGRTGSPFVDWFQAETVEQAREEWARHCKNSGIPAAATCEVHEMDPITLKPITEAL